MTRFLAAACATALLLGCSGKSESNDGGKGASAGTAGAGGGTAGSGQGGTATAGAGASAGRAGDGGSGSGNGGTSGAASGSGGKAGGSAGSGGSGNAGGGGREGSNGGAGAGGTSGAAAGGAGRGGSDAGAAGESGTYCGGMLGVGCPPLEYCDFGGFCALADATGVCTTQPVGACSADRVCGCDGKVYANDCRAHSAGVDTTDSGLCTKFSSGGEGQACVTDDDCTGELKCCSSPVGVVSCTTPMGSGCPLTP